ncbi:MAG TPA: ABC transporter permease subunit [Anaerolineales bacterium]|nr:ABC transporter permease subunit [Anaerolineales bacterium]
MESTTSIPENKKMTKWRNPFRPVLDNPVILKELRGRMRGRQAFVLLTVYLGLIAVFIMLVYNLLGLTSSITWDPSARQGAGKAIFGTVVLLELLLLSFIAPGLTAGAITSERERQTFEILRTTLLSARSLVLGKLSSALSFLFLLILSALPIQSLAFLLGGVGLGEMVASSLMLVVTAVFFCTLGIFFSSFMKRTLSATVASYAVILLTFLILVVIFFLVAYVESFSYNTFGSQTMEYVLTMILWFLISTNPLMAAVISEVILVDQQSLFYTTNSLFGSSGPSILISPWLIYVVFYLFLTLVLMLLSIYYVKRPDR